MPTSATPETVQNPTSGACKSRPGPALVCPDRRLLRSTAKTGRISSAGALPHLLRMPPVMKMDEAYYPVDISPLRPYAVVLVTSHLANPPKQGCGLLHIHDVVPDQNTSARMNSTIPKKHKARAFHGAAFAGLYGGELAYTSKTPSTSR